MAVVSRALIIGGGIAGLSAAIALAKIGVSCDVVEIGEGPVGAGMSISGRVLDVLEELGVYDECYASGASFTPEMAAPVMKDIAGRPIGAPPVRPERPGAKPPMRVFRPVFARILEDAARRHGVVIRKGVSFDTIEDRADVVVMTFTDGETNSYDLVLGADGVGSRTRQCLFPDAPKPAYAGQMSIRWMVPASAIEGEGWYVAGSAGRLGFFHLPHQEVIYVPIVFAMEEQRLSQDEAYRLVKALLDKFTAPPIIHLRQHLRPDSTLIARPFHWILLPRPWYKGRVLLVGDASHATTAHLGMGAGMALEDSVVLAECIAGASSLPAALEAFMARRFERVRLVVDTSLQLSRYEQAGETGLEAPLMSAAFAALAQPY